ncbi:hypothetical protein AVEN_143453-1 [Araneus ventricosus]|uniref:Uncharacterized protein n=1 Tax=Araneus ventricosus TaxID=182803 RepID=A0A4Y2HCJ9_ARAVE|nr:hypothetical protein AVEN_143453-1 [Araneus ventricosus]
MQSLTSYSIHVTPTQIESAVEAKMSSCCCARQFVEEVLALVSSFQSFNIQESRLIFKVLGVYSGTPGWVGFRTLTTETMSTPNPTGGTRVDPLECRLTLREENISADR